MTAAWVGSAPVLTKAVPGSTVTGLNVAFGQDGGSGRPAGGDDVEVRPVKTSSALWQPITWICVPVAYSGTARFPVVGSVGVVTSRWRLTVSPVTVVAVTGTVAVPLELTVKSPLTMRLFGSMSKVVLVLGSLTTRL